MSDIIANAKQLLDGAMSGPWIVSSRSFGVIDAIGPIERDPTEGLDVDSGSADLAAAAPELAEIVASLTTEYIAEWCDNGVWAPIEMDMFDGTFANLRAAQGYIEVAKKQAPYEITRIVRRLVSPQVVINE